MIQLHKILDVKLCYALLRAVRWKEGVCCPKCSSKEIISQGKGRSEPECLRYNCKSCGKYFDDVTDTIFSGTQQGMHKWMTVLYLMNLNVSMRQISMELEVTEETAYNMCSAIGEEVVKKSLVLSLAGQLKLTNVVSLQHTKDSPTK